MGYISKKVAAYGQFVLVNSLVQNGINIFPARRTSLSTKRGGWT